MISESASEPFFHADTHPTARRVHQPFQAMRQEALQPRDHALPAVIPSRTALARFVA